MTIKLYTGPMYAEKSKNLIDFRFRTRLRDEDVLAIRPDLRDRDDGDFIKSRSYENVRKIPCEFIDQNNPERLLELVRERNPKLLILDEIQFYTMEEPERLAQVLTQIQEEKPDINIYCAGLDNFGYNAITRKIDPCGTTQAVIAIADHTQYLTAPCYNCPSDDGIFTKKIMGDFTRKQQTETEGARYAPACKKCAKIIMRN